MPEISSDLGRRGLRPSHPCTAHQANAVEMALECCGHVD